MKIREIETEERLNALLAASYEKRVAQARRTQAALTKMDYVAAKRAAASAYPRQMQGLAVKGKVGLGCIHHGGSPWVMACGAHTLSTLNQTANSAGDHRI